MPYWRDTSTLKLRPIRVPKNSRNPEKGEAGIQWPTILKLITGNTLMIFGRIQFDPTYYVGTTTDPDDPTFLDDTGRTTTQHEQHHDEIAKIAWNNSIEILNRFEGTYCTSECAEIAGNIVISRDMYAYYIHAVQQMDFDFEAYGSKYNYYYANELKMRRNQYESSAEKGREAFMAFLMNYQKARCGSPKK